MGGISGYSTNLNNMGAVFTFSGGRPYGEPTIPSLKPGTQADAQLGYSVSGAGDVNGDGYTDFVAGAPFHISSGIKSGGVFLFYGNSTNPATAIQIPELQKDSQTGASVGGAGDVNGDGYSDVLVGASHFDEGSLIDAGRVYLYYGSATGLNPSPKVIEGIQTGAKLGSSVSGAGDVNGDGFSDIIVGSPEFDRGEVNEGTAVVYYGSPTGITDSGYRTLELNNTEGLFGCAVASAGDVDGDGYGDVVVGVKGYSKQFVRQGAAAIYRGSVDGIIPYPWKVLEGPQAECAFGSAVAGTGDNNSDGFSDIVIGAPLYDINGGTDNGAAWLYHGNSMSPGYINTADGRLHLLNDDLKTKITINQLPKGNFGIRVDGKSVTGGGKGRLVWETRGAGEAFSRSAANTITNSTQFTAMQDVDSWLKSNGTQLTSLVPKEVGITKIRARVKFSAVWALTGQMYGPWRYASRTVSWVVNQPTPHRNRIESDKTKSELDSIFLYPNPVSKTLFLRNSVESGNATIRILSTSGEQVLSVRMGPEGVDLSRVSPGNYVVEIIDGVTRTTRRLIISR